MLSVSELNEQAKNLLEAHFSYVEVRGEISRLIKHNSGHWYFTLKDEKSSISAVIYKINNIRLKFEILDGLSVIVYGKVSLYSQGGSYKLIATSIKPEGEGELEFAFKQLKEKLENEGLFDISHKKPLPTIPSRIGLITSSTSAALQDMLRIAKGRWKLAKIFIFDALTQGSNAPLSIIKALQKADNCSLDVIILARGGGSREDLWCFNDESLAREIFIAKTPIVSAIGHEIDYVISDFVSDMRSPTPSSAIIQVLPDENEFLHYIDTLDDTLKNTFLAKISKLENSLNLISARLSPRALKNKIELKISQIFRIREQLDGVLKTKILKLQSRLNELEGIYKARQSFFEATNHLVQIRFNGKNTELSTLKSGDNIDLVSQNISKNARIL